MNSKLHAVCDGHGRPLILLLSEGQMSDYKGAAKMLHAFPKAKALLADKGYDADWFRDALAERKITACIPSRANRKDVIPYDPALYKRCCPREWCSSGDCRAFQTGPGTGQLAAGKLMSGSSLIVAIVSSVM
ncbi:transposase [Brucella sp. 6810]|nr:transposase [Brucella sp. 6810]